MSNYYTLFLVRLALLAGLLLYLQPLSAQRKIWLGAVNNSWSDGRNWNPAGAPGPTNDVVFDDNAQRPCVVNIDPVIRSLDVGGDFMYSINLGSRTLAVGGDFDVAAAPLFISGPGSKVIFNATSDINCAASIYEMEINAPANATIDLRAPLDVSILTITQVGMLDGDDLRASQQIINNDPDLDGRCFLTAAGATTFTGNPIRLLHVEAGATLQLLSNLTLERDFHLLGEGDILAGGTLVLGSEGQLEFTGSVGADVEVNTSDPAHKIDLQEDFIVTGTITFSQVGEFQGNHDIRAAADIVANDNDIGPRAFVVATGNGALSGSGPLTNLTVETGATLQLANDFPLNDDFELRGGGDITGPFNLILGSPGRVEFTGTVSNVEINGPSVGKGIRFQENFNITNDLTITQIHNLSRNEIRVGGDITITDPVVGGSAHLVMAGGGTTTFQGPGGGSYITLVVDKDNAADRAQLNSSDEFLEVIIRQGVLDLNGQTPTAGVALIEGNGTLGGVGTMNCPVEGLAGGQVSPGNSPGTMSIIGDLTIAGTLVMEVAGRGDNAGGVAGTDFDQLIVDGDANIGTVSIVFLSPIGPTFPVSGDMYTLVSATGDNLNGGFTITPPNVNASYGLGILFISSPAFPIELLYFSAAPKGEAILLQWATATEQNNDYMAVERSADGIRFEEIGRVKGAGATQERQDYRFTDERPLPGLNYYRLRQVDYDGATEYHRIVSVLFDGKERGLGLLAFPNPAQSALQARWAPDPDKAATLRLHDAAGRLLSEYQAPAGAGAYEVQLEGMPSGLFFLEVRQGEEVEFVKLLKQ